MSRAERRRQNKRAQKSGKAAQPSSFTRPLAIEQTIRDALELHRAQRLAEAVWLYRQILSADPDNVEVHSYLGLALEKLGERGEAAAHYRQAIRLAPNFAIVHFNLGNVLRDLSRPAEAIACYREAVALEPRFASAHQNLGILLRAGGLVEDAVAHLNKSIALKPSVANYHNNLGNALADMGRLDKAADSYRKAIARNPALAEAHSNLGNMLCAQGKMEAAGECFRHAIALKPEFAEAHRQLTLVKEYAERDEDLRAMEALYASQEIDDEQRMHLAFGLGRAYENLKQYDKAFRFIAEGNALKRRRIDYSTDQTERYFDYLKRPFTPDFLEGAQVLPANGPTPIFVLGMPRSGTTLVEQMLASHPEVFGAGELSALRAVVTHRFARPGNPGFPDAIRAATPETLVDAARDYIDRLKALSAKRHFVTDKMPHNFELIGMIKLMLPHAKVIHCRRDPLDICQSIFKNYFRASGHSYAYDQRELGEFYKLYEDLMAHWHRLMPGFIYDVQYEDIVADPRKEIASVLSFCGLEYNEACLRFHDTERPVVTASASQVRKPVYAGSIQAWRRYETYLTPLSEALGRS